MKITVITSNTQTISDSDSIKVPLNELSSVENASCLIINLADAMDYVPFNQRKDVLNLAISKLRPGGEIYISGSDMYAIGHYIIEQLTSAEQINTSLYGGRLSCNTMFDVTELCRELDCETINSKLDGLYYSIKARKKCHND